jgi:hypothetical protein
LAVGIGGWARDMRARQAEHVQLLRKAIDRHLQSRPRGTA